MLFGTVFQKTAVAVATPMIPLLCWTLSLFFDVYPPNASR